MFENIIVKEYMSDKVITIGKNTPIAEAHQLMKDKSIRRLIVVEGETPVGLVTIGD